MWNGNHSKNISSVTMISIILTIDSTENLFEECISSILMQHVTDLEIICVVNSSNYSSLNKLKNFEKKDERIKIIVNNVSDKEQIMKKIGLKYARGNYILFLNSTTNLHEDSLDFFPDFCMNNSFDMLIFSDDDVWSNNFAFNETNVLNHSNFSGKDLFKLLTNEFNVIYSKKLLGNVDFTFLNRNYFEWNNLFFLQAFFASNSFIFHKNLFSENIDLSRNNQKKVILKIKLFKLIIEKFIKDEQRYEFYNNEFWNYIFGSIFNFIYDLRDETLKRNYFKDSKLLFDEFCFDKGYYEDIQKSLDIMTWEFFNQTLEDVYYIPIKRAVSRRLVNENFGPLTIAIKSPHPIGEPTWGDYFFAIALKKSFEKRGFKVVIHELQNWYREDDNEDIVIVLRGLSKYNPNPKHINIMWNISHPEVISLEEYNSYDIVFISSVKYANEMDKKLDTVVKPLLQCTDPDVFYPNFNSDCSEDILFIGRTRKVFRDIIKDISKTNHDFSVYGEGWEDYIDKKFIKGEFVQNDVLNQYYSSCKILLNDHWAEMKELDFPSNRLFDALACGAFIISDNIPSAHDLFENNIVTYDSIEDLDKKIDFYLTNELERDKKRKAGMNIVLSKHTFDNRADEIIETLKNITF